LAAAAAEMMEQRGLPSLHSLTPADENLRVITVSNLFEPSEAPNPNRDGGEAYTAWEESMVDDIWAECCRHGEVERIRIFVGDSACMCRAAVRFDNLAAATAAVDALDGRYFAERSLVAEFDDGALSSQLPRGSDTAR